jgi:hypothetical protein
VVFAFPAHISASVVRAGYFRHGARCPPRAEVWVKVIASALVVWGPDQVLLFPDFQELEHFGGSI